MPWTRDGPAAGFSASADTWLPVDPAHRLLAAAVQEADPSSTLNVTRRLIALRKSSPALTRGEAVIEATPPSILGFERRLGQERLLCLFELGGETADAGVEPGTELLLSLNGGARSAKGLITLPPYGGVVLRLPPADWVPEVSGRA